MIEIAEPKEKIIPLSDIVLSYTSQISRISEATLKGRSRRWATVRWRHIAMTAALRCFEVSLSEVGEWFNRDHSTVIHGRDRILDEIASRTDRGHAMDKDLTELCRRLLAYKGGIAYQKDEITDENAKREIDFLHNELKRANIESTQAQSEAKRLKVVISNLINSIAQAEQPDWPRIEKLGQEIGWEGVMSYFRAWIDTQQGRTIPRRLTQ